MNVEIFKWLFVNIYHDPFNKQKDGFDWDFCINVNNNQKESETELLCQTQLVDKEEIKKKEKAKIMSRTRFATYQNYRNCQSNPHRIYLFIIKKISETKSIINIEYSRIVSKLLVRVMGREVWFYPLVCILNKITGENCKPYEWWEKQDKQKRDHNHELYSSWICILLQVSDTASLRVSSFSFTYEIIPIYLWVCVLAK